MRGISLIKPVPRVVKSGVIIDGGNCEILAQRVEDGEIVYQSIVKNLVVSSGRDIIRDLLSGIGPHPNLMAVGTDQTQTSDLTYALGNEVYRTQTTRTIQSGSKMTKKLFLAADEANGFTLAEVGLFSQATYANDVPLNGGTLFARATFTPVAKDSSVTITFTWEFLIRTAT